MKFFAKVFGFGVTTGLLATQALSDGQVVDNNRAEKIKLMQMHDAQANVEANKNVSNELGIKRLEAIPFSEGVNSPDLYQTLSSHF